MNKVFNKGLLDKYLSFFDKLIKLERFRLGSIKVNWMLLIVFYSNFLLLKQLKVLNLSSF